MPDEFSPAFSYAFDPLVWTPPTPDLGEDDIVVGCNLVANMGACYGADGTTSWETLSQSQKEVVAELAITTLNHLTAGAVANCPVLLRPCSPGCCAVSDAYHGYGVSWSPYLDSSGRWVNGCGCQSACACTFVQSLDLGPGWAEVLGVSIDGEVLPETEYDLVGGRWLRPAGGREAWPVTQDLDQPITELDTFAVYARPGYPLGPLGEAALGRLICEYSKGMCGQKCALPKGVTSIVRQGVSMTITDSLYPDGLTTIREVDTYIRAVNPNQLTSIPSVWSPDIQRQRVY
jgi:hypothetical protein